MLNVAEELVTLPALLVTVTLYLLPSWLACAAAITYDVDVAPAIALPASIH
jgi:hypothetical protein